MHNYEINKLRINDLLADIKQTYSGKRGLVLLFAGFENDRYKFIQESSFYYLTGITEPAVVLMIDFEGYKTLYIPNCLQERSKWVVAPLELNDAYARKIGVDEIKLLGTSCSGYQMHPFFSRVEYGILLQDLEKKMQHDAALFTFAPKTPSGYIEQRLVLQRLSDFGFKHEIVDISDLVACMRRSKDMHEIELMYKAAEITCLAQESAARAIGNMVNEAEVQAALEYMMTGSQASIAFPSIVASGKNAAVLHYMNNDSFMQEGDLAVVDIGANYKGYCADITRTYPVSGVFTERQRDIYTVVLETQEYIASLAKPGLWLSNKEKPEESLNHLAHLFLKEKGYDKYFPHGIGHFLGLDVHDVGNYVEPLKVGDVITIEPGIYIAEERIGIRIEDDYWIVKDGVVCLSEGLPKSAGEVEAMVKEKFER